MASSQRYRYKRDRSKYSRLDTVACLATYFGALLLPWLAVATWMFAAESFSSFWFWTVTYPLRYAVEPSAQQAFANLGNYLPRVFNPTWPYWALAAGGLLVLWKPRQRSDRRVFLLGWLAASTIALVPGLHFRPHYFLLVLPVSSVLGALTQKMLAGQGLHERVARNQKLDSPTGHYLVNQIRAGSLDAVVVYRSNGMANPANLLEHRRIVVKP